MNRFPDPRLPARRRAHLPHAACALRLRPPPARRRGALIHAPKLLLNGREDEEHPWLTRALPLWNLLSEPKELQLFDGVGHLPPADVRIPTIRDFLDRHLT